MQFNFIKKTFLCVLSLLTFKSIAQKGWYIGPELGTNAIIIEDNDLGKKIQLGFHGGLNAEYHFNDYFSLRSSISATQKRQANETLDSVEVNTFGLDGLVGIDGLNLYSYTGVKTNVSQFYLELPIMAAYTYERVSVFAGPYVGYMFRSHTRQEVETNTPFLKVVDVNELLGGGGEDPTGGLISALLPPAESVEFEETTSQSGLRTLDFGVKAGVRYEMESLGINLNYLYGIYGYKVGALAFNNNSRHSYLQLTLNYNFRL